MKQHNRNFTAKRLGKNSSKAREFSVKNVLECRRIISIRATQYRTTSLRHAEVDLSPSIFLAGNLWERYLANAGNLCTPNLLHLGNCIS